eukprot:215426-Hanusia_phi.AAC.2
MPDGRVRRRRRCALAIGGGKNSILQDENLPRREAVPARRAGEDREVGEGTRNMIRPGGEEDIQGHDAAAGGRDEVHAASLASRVSLLSLE